MANDGFKPTWIVLHHSATHDGPGNDFEAIRRYHIEVNRWKEIGYHLVIEMENGKLAVKDGRKIGTVGAHALGYNDKSVGICLVGNYDKEPPSADRLFLLASVCRELQRRFSIPADQVVGHWETYLLRGAPIEKSCPGTAFDLTAFRTRLLEVKAA